MSINIFKSILMIKSHSEIELFFMVSMTQQLASGN